MKYAGGIISPAGMCQRTRSSAPDTVRSDAETTGWRYGSNSPLLSARLSLSADTKSLFILPVLHFMDFSVQPGHQQHPEIPHTRIFCQPGIMPVQPTLTRFRVQGTVSSSLRKTLQCLSLSGRQAEFTGTGCLSVQFHADSSFQ